MPIREKGCFCFAKAMVILMRINTLSIIISLALICGIVSCGDNTTPEVTTAVNSDTTVETTGGGIPELPERDLEGFTLSMGKPVQANVAWSTVTFAPAEENGEVLNDAIHRRNTAMCEKYGFELVELELDNPLNTLNQQNLAGDTEFDIFLIPLNKVNSIANSDNLVDFHDIPNIELSGEWWDQDMIRDLDIGGGQYFMNGDVIFTIYDCLRVIMYNKGYAEDLKLDGFYELVGSGDWTVDKMYEYMTLAAVDLNSDGRMDYQDVFGLMYNTNSYDAYLTSQNVKLIDADGNLGVFDERFNKAYENILKIFDRNLVFHYNDDKYPGLDARQAIVTMFDNKQVLFFENGMSAAAQYMRDVQNVDFGFLPLPKLDAAQDKYYSYVSVSAPVLCVPVTTTDRLADTGFVLEALCRESSKSVVPEYFETCFSSKYTHDEESYDMILLATESRMYDLGIIFDYGKILTTITNAAKAGDTAITSKLESIREAVVAEFNENR